MNDQQNDGTAAAALGAHSKDSHPAAARAAAHAENTGYAAVDRLASSASHARQRVTGAGGTVEQVAGMVREQPIAAVLATGFAGLIVGLLIGRR